MTDKTQLARIDQKLTDFMNMYREHRDEDAKKWERLDSLAKRVSKMETPIKWASGLVTVSAIGVFTALGEKAAKWLLHR